MVHKLYKNLISEGYTFFTGVPDSGLKPFQDAIINSSKDIQHVIAANEGQAVGIAVGAELAGIKSCVYLQNSDIMPLLVIGHRHTLPQHKVMGETDEEMLKLIGYKNYIIVRGDNNAN